jgi:hypothetical protein
MGDEMCPPLECRDEWRERKRDGEMREREEGRICLDSAVTSILAAFSP